MTKRPVNRKRLSRGGANLRPMRLVLEPLEARRLLAGMDFSSVHSNTTVLTLDYWAVATAAPQTSTTASVNSQLPSLQAEGEAAENTFELIETAPYGTLLGTITFENPPSDQQYTLQSVDPRFYIDGDQLYFYKGELDFESEPMISLLINAVKHDSQVIASTDAVVIVEDANERPQAIELSGGQVVEHQPGAIIGDLHVVDPDAGAQSTYAFYLFDARFALSGNQLQLADGVELDFASDPEVLLAVAATDGFHEIFDTVRIQVLQSPDTPVAISSIALDPRQVVELTAGASVGRASVIDPKDSAYEFSVSDARFEFVGNQLKLRDDRQVDAVLEPEISLTVTAVGDQGDEASGTFAVTVIGARSPYHNYNLNEDVNGDGFVSPIDALLIINELNSHGSGPIDTVGGGSGEGPPPMLDVNGDGMITPIDVLLIINHLNRTRTLQYGPTHNSVVEQPSIVDFPSTIPRSKREATLQSGDQQPIGSQDTLAASIRGADSSEFLGQSTEHSADRRRRENASIDAELELLLDQLTHSRSAAL